MLCRKDTAASLKMYIFESTAVCSVNKIPSLYNINLAVFATGVPPLKATSTVNYKDS